MSFYLGQLSDFCVFGFAFCSGYAHMTQYEHPDYYKQRLKGLLRILCSYWLILILFSLICIIIGQGSFMPGSFSKFILNAMTLENSYNGAWWYMFAYVVLVLLSPMLLKVVKKMHPLVVLSIGFAVYCAAYYLRFRITTDNWLLIKAGPLGMTLFEYLIGAVCCRTQLFTKLYRYWGKIRQPWRWLIAVFFVHCHALCANKGNSQSICCSYHRLCRYFPISFLAKAEMYTVCIFVYRKTFHQHLVDAHVFLFSAVQRICICCKISDINFYTDACCNASSF